MKKTDYIQVFLIGDSTPEINGIELSFLNDDDLVHIRSTEDGVNSITEHIVPLAQVRMIRRWTEE